MSVVCVVLLTSSQAPGTRARAWAQGPWLCLLETAFRSASKDGLVRTIARTPPPAFLFPIQRFQRPDWETQTRRCARRRRRGASLDARPGSVNRFVNYSRRLWKRAQRSPWARRGLPHQSIGVSIEGAEDTLSASEKQDLYGISRTFRRLTAASEPRGAAYNRPLIAAQALLAAKPRPRGIQAAWI
jgi:hypothetical protein